MNADYVDDKALLANTSTQAESQSHSLEQAAGGISFLLHAEQTEYMCFTQKGDISIQNGGFFKLAVKFRYLKSSVSATENNISM